MAADVVGTKKWDVALFRRIRFFTPSIRDTPDEFTEFGDRSCNPTLWEVVVDDLGITHD
jgi:hypothetical protein